MTMSDEVFMGFNNVHYVNHSYQAIGNDGNHFNLSINEGSNSAVPSTVADALFTVSDHLPVTMKLAIYAKLDVDDQPQHDLLAYAAPNPASESVRLSFYSPCDGPLQIELMTLQGQLLLTEACSFDEGPHQLELPISRFKSGLYLLRLSSSQGHTQTIKLGIK